MNPTRCGLQEEVTKRISWRREDSRCEAEGEQRERDGEEERRREPKEGRKEEESLFAVVGCPFVAPEASPRRKEEAKESNESSYSNGDIFDRPA